jgi:predicted membrane GTPase involved in stress response
VAIRVEQMENRDTFRVSGRGELQLSVLIENMRREVDDTRSNRLHASVLN